ncbi:unnamed protein product [Timema podura]|uniref:Nipped-B protein n=1 Tax=Timema podura TaxID=61482 RepID=A0ABN7NY78_TIMPD|nr:unnamed protein product [Timema podura]
MKPKLLEKNGHTLVPELNQSIVEPNVLGTTERQTLFKELEVKLESLKTNDEITIQQFKLKKELKVLVEKLSPDILSQISTKSYYKEELISKSHTKLKCSIEALLNELEDSIVIAELDEDAHIPSEILIPVGQLEILSSEAVESKINNATSSISTTHLVKLLKILEKNIQNGMSVSLISNHDDEDESELFLEMALERIMRAVYASLIGFHIMASSNMPKIIYLEDFIEKVIQFTQYQLKNSVFPSFDPQYRTISKVKVNGKSKKHKTNTKVLKISHGKRLMYRKMAELVTLLAELINVQVLTDNSLLHASSIGVAIFFVNNIEQIQLSSLNLVTTIFMKHENYQRLILDDILSSLVRLSGGKNCLRTFKLQSGEYIQMFTALVLQLIQCTVYIPDHILKSLNFDVSTYILKKYEIARKAAAYFLSMFLEKCGAKSEDTCFRTLFDNFVLDLFMVFTKPEWPCAELMINLLGKLLVSKFITKEVDMTLRTASLDIIGIIAVNLRKNYLLLQQRLTTMDNIFQEIKAMGELKLNNLVDENNYLLQVPEYEQALYLQSALVDYLSRCTASDQTFTHSRLFYLASWYQDVLSEQKKESHVKKVSYNKEKKYKDKHKNEDSKSANHFQINTDLRANIVEIQKQFTIKSIVGIGNSNKKRPFDRIAHTLIDYKSVELICLYLFCKSSSSRNFDIYLNRVSSVLADSSIAIRTKALKCLTTIVEVDPNVLGMKEMQNSVKNSFFDQSSSVREAAVDLVGKFILCQPDLINMYYEMIAPRILDTSVSVRKRVIRIFKEICMACPEFPKIEDICLKMIHRVSDEDGIKKLVVEAFQNIFFIPNYEKHESYSSALLYKVNIISRVVSECSDVALDLFEKLLENLFRPEDNRHELIKHRMKVKPSQNCVIACQQIIDSLVKNVEKLEPSFVEHKQSPESSKLVLMYFSTMHLFAKVHPLLLMNHGATLQPYLTLKCLNPEDYQIISCVARLFELVVPIMENPSVPFLSQLQDNFLYLISQHDCAVVSSSVSCLATLVNNMTHNFALVRACFEKYYICLCRFKDLHSQAFSRSVLNLNLCTILCSQKILSLIKYAFRF